jgi:DNA-binding NtrC family response regulator
LPRRNQASSFSGIAVAKTAIIAALLLNTTHRSKVKPEEKEMNQAIIYHSSEKSDGGGYPNLLIVENQDAIHKLLKKRFSSAIRLEKVPFLERVPESLKSSAYDMVICAVESSDPARAKLHDAFEFLSRNSPQTQVIVVSDEEPEPPYCLLKNATYQYIPHPIDTNGFCDLVKVALEKRPLRRSMLAYPELRVLTEFEGMIGISLPMRDVFQKIIDASSADIPVFITGETGTGKDLVAAAIHNRSERKNKPYVPVNTGAIAPELIASELFGHERGAYTGAIERRQGYFEQADGGTIFLDEISTMDERTQVGLLRILENKRFRRLRGDKDIHVDVRVIAATNDSLEEAITQRRFREDLYYRLNVFHIHLPPLRDRPGAVTLLTNNFVIVSNDLYGKTVKSITPETYRYLRRYRWPGNVRELKHVIQRAVLMSKGEELTADLLPERIKHAAEKSSACRVARFPPVIDSEPPQSIRPGMTLKAVEKEFITMTLAATRGNRKHAALQLGISRRALYNKLQKYSLSYPRT